VDDQIGDNGAEHDAVFRCDDVACACLAASSRYDFEHARGGFDAVSTGNAAELGRAPAIATDADAKRGNFINRVSAQAHVSCNAVEIERGATVDRDRDFGRKSSSERTPCEGKAQIGGEHASIDDVFCVEAGQRVG
jgi:hypothetical protein